MDAVKDVLGLTAEHAARFLGTLDTRRVGPEATAEELVEALGGPLPEQGADDAQIVSELVATAEPGLVGM